MVRTQLDSKDTCRGTWGPIRGIINGEDTRGDMGAHSSRHQWQGHVGREVAADLGSRQQRGYNWTDMVLKGV